MKGLTFAFGKFFGVTFTPTEKGALGFMVDLTFGFNASLKMAVEVFSVKSCSV